jgi:DNA-binding beta-propeller fold protein YncE
MINVVLNSPPGSTMPVWTTTSVAPPYMQRRARRGGCVAPMVMLVLLLVFAAGAYSFIQRTSPYFFANLFAGGYARLDQTFDAQANGANLLQSPMDIALDDKNNIYVLDDVRQLVARFDPAGTYVSSWPVGGKDKRLDSVAADKAGDVYVVANGRLDRYAASNGSLLGTGGIADIFGVSDLCLLPDGTLVGYANGNGDSLVHFDAKGAEIGRVKNPISESSSGSPPVTWEVQLAAGKDGSVYLLSTAPFKEGVYVFGPDLKYKRHFGTDGSADGQLDNPSAIAVDSKGRIYVDDWKGVQVFDPSGNYIGIIRLPFRGIAGGMAFNSRDELYLVSRSQDKVYKFVLNGQ